MSLIACEQLCENVMPHKTIKYYILIRSMVNMREAGEKGLNI